MGDADVSTTRRLTKEERQFLVDKYFESGKKITEALKAWDGKYGTKRPARGTVAKLIEKYEKTGSVDDKKPEYGFFWARPVFQAEKVATGTKIYHLKILLSGSRPQIWRRVLVPENMTFLDMSRTVIRAMGWHGTHAWMFRIPGQDYDICDKSMMMGMDCSKDAETVKLCDVFGENEGLKNVCYEYDMGDGWQHLITLEKIVRAEPNRKYPACVAGKNACPPEDCGGIYGYQNLLEALRDPDHQEHDELKAWVEGCGYENFDPKRFSPLEVDFDVLF